MAPTVLACVVPGLKRRLAHWEETGRRLTASPDIQAGGPFAWEVFDHGLSAFRRKRLDPVARNLEAWIADKSDAHDRPERIILVGHSAGALLARKAWLNCVDPGQGADFTGGDWGKHVTRFVLFAGVSRGVDMDRFLGRRILTKVAELIPGRFTFEEGMRGSAFITNLRIGWMRHLARLDPAEVPAMIQLLGTKDDFITREDNLDLEQFPHSTPINIPDAGHGDLFRLDVAPDPEARLQRFVRAFTQPPPQPADPAPEAQTTEDVLMIVHGIRASSIDNWVKRAEERARALWPGVVTARPTYGYLSAVRFALPNVRRRYGRFFRDFYTEVLARHRNARISVLCHSNGTYALGHSLAEFNAIRLERVALAGSVLPTQYDWTGLINSGRVKAVRNDGGDSDVPVALLCNGLRGLLMKDVGTGGFDGFLSSSVTDVRYHEGGHGSMLSDANLDSMIAFLMGRSDPLPKTRPVRPLIRMASRLMTYLAPLLLVGALAAIVASTFAWGLIGLAGAILVLMVLLILLDIF